MLLHIRGAFIIIFKMNKNKKYPDEYKLTHSSTTIVYLLLWGIIVWFAFEFSRSIHWLLQCCIYSSIIFFLVCIILDVEYAIFNRKGVLIVNTIRWTKRNAKHEFYIDWKDIKHIRLRTHLSNRQPTTIEIVPKVLGRVYYERTFLPFGKFASLAKYYSGREDIIYKKKRKKPGLYEKDW